MAPVSPFRLGLARLAASASQRVDPFDFARHFAGDVRELSEGSRDRAHCHARERFAELGHGLVEALPEVPRTASRPETPGRMVPRTAPAAPGGRIDGAPALSARSESEGRGCARCAGAGRTCPSCVQRRRYAWILVTERGQTLEATSQALRLPVGRIRQLVEEEKERRELASLRCDSIPVARTRAVIEEVLARDPDLKVADIAHWLDMSQIDFERAFLGRTKQGQPKQRVTVSSASRLMIALGRAPYELPGC
jgi:hypothetical protein